MALRPSNVDRRASRDDGRVSRFVADAKLRIFVWEPS
jgi:hypothetical protein